MRQRAFADLQVSRLVLGTAQLGLSYGIANTLGQPSYESAREIIAAAYESGVNCLDTAAAYGSSEEVIGRAISELGIADEMVIVTKVTHMASGLTASEADRIVERSVTNSLKLLHLESLPLCLFHREENYPEYANSLLKLKERGLVRHVGSSVNTIVGAAKVVRSTTAEGVQLAASVLDQRAIRQGVVTEAAEKGVSLFVRSVFLQGLLMMPDAEILPELAAVIPVRAALRSLASGAGMSLPELAVRFILGLDGEPYLVLGAESVDQVKANAALVSKAPLEPEVHRAVCEAVPDLPEAVIMPIRWSKRMPDAKLASS